MSRKEVPRTGLVQAALTGRITNREGARALHLSIRQFQRLKGRARDGGVGALRHQSRGRPWAGGCRRRSACRCRRCCKTATRGSTIPSARGSGPAPGLPLLAGRGARQHHSARAPPHRRAARRAPPLVRPLPGGGARTAGRSYGRVLRRPAHRAAAGAGGLHLGPSPYLARRAPAGPAPQSAAPAGRARGAGGGDAAAPRPPPLARLLLAPRPDQKSVTPNAGDDIFTLQNPRHFH